MEDNIIYLPGVYSYQGNIKNTVEYRIVPIGFASLFHTIDGEKVETHKPLAITVYRIDHLQCRHLGNTWSEDLEYYTSIEKAKEKIFSDKGLELIPDL